MARAAPPGAAAMIRAMADTPLTVVGAGVVGLAVAARLAPRFPELVVLERRERHGTETSSRNSEVIHGGMYYPEGSLKARLCVRGRELLYEHCERLGVPHQRVTKLIVAHTLEETAELERLLALGRANGVPLELVTPGALPRARARGARGRGPVLADDGHRQRARADGLLPAGGAPPRRAAAGAGRAGGDRAARPRLPSHACARPTGSSRSRASASSTRPASSRTRSRRSPGIDVEAAGYRLHWWKGSYFALSGPKARLVSRLVYPVPTHVSLGVHAVLGLDGRLRFGPDAEHLPGRTADYAVCEARRPAFAEAVRRLLPAVEDEELTPDIAGIRPKLQGPGDGFRDFVIAEETARGLPGLVDLVGIDSPGLTSSAAIAEEVDRLLPA